MSNALSKIQPVKIDLSDSPLWHRWLQPLWAASQFLPAPFDASQIASDMVAYDAADTSSYRVELLAVLRHHLTAAKHTIEQDFLATHDGAVYVGQHARCIDALLRLLRDAGLQDM